MASTFPEFPFSFVWALSTTWCCVCVCVCVCSGILNLSCGSFIVCGQEVSSVGLQTLHCCDRGFESCRGHGHSSLVFAACRVGTGLCEDLIAHSEESYPLCLTVYDLEISTVRQPRSKLGCCTTERGKKGHGFN